MNSQQMTEAEITRAAARHMGATAIPTMLLTFTAIFAYVALFAAAASNLLPVWLCFVATSYLIYAIYTPLHEAVHRNISGKNKNLLWLNNLIGYLSASLLGVSFTMHKAAHMAHHRATNVEGDDPDFVTRGSSLFDIVTCGNKMVIGEYRDYFVKVFPRASTSEKVSVVAEIFVFVGWRVGLALAGFGVEVLVFSVLANIVGTSLLGYIFAWIVHTPFNETERYRDTATILLPNAIHRPVTWLWLWQNYHSIHHLFPRVPFYRYAQLFEEIGVDMEARGAPVVRLGQTPALA